MIKNEIFLRAKSLIVELFGNGTNLERILEKYVTNMGKVLAVGMCNVQEVLK